MVDVYVVDDVRELVYVGDDDGVLVNEPVIEGEFVFVTEYVGV